LPVSLIDANALFGFVQNVLCCGDHSAMFLLHPSAILARDPGPFRMVRSITPGSIASASAIADIIYVACLVQPV
jgi:hypothetical protein